MDTKLQNFQVIMGAPEKINPSFAKVKIHILYTGKNRNGSYISRETVEKMIPSLYNIPIVGEWKDQNDNFGGHGGKLEISDEGFKIIDTTKPYGVVPSDTDITWETIREKDGITEHEYLTCWAYLWYGRYPEIDKILNDGANQSMEICITNGDDNEELNAYEIKDAYFSALCILGKDSDPDKNVEPCFEGADIKSYSLNKEEFKKEFAEMVYELKTSLNKMDSNVKEEVVMPEDENAKEVVNTEVAEQEFEQAQPEENKEDDVVIEEPINYQELYEAKSKEFDDLKIKLDELTTNYANLESEVTQLKKFKEQKLAEERKLAEDELFARYEEELKGIDEFDNLKKNSSNFTLEDLEKEIAFIYVKSKTSFALKKENTVVKVKFDAKPEAESTPYGGLIEKYKNK